MSQTDTLVPLGSTSANSGLSSSQAWDYLHINSVDKDERGDYLLSSRHFSTIFKVNGTDGSIIWRLGGRHPSFTQTGNWTFGFQHHARWRPELSQTGTEVFSFFDNSGDGTITYNDVSRALIVQVNHTDHTANILRKATAPYGLQAQSQGNAQVLSDGRIFVNWGSEGAFTEFDSHNKVVYHAFIEDAVSYRGFVSNWTGTPTEAPALVALRGSPNRVELHVSWNGDTEATAWKFFFADSTGTKQKRSLLGEVQRHSFETVFSWDSPHVLTPSSKFFAQAVGRDGALLSQTTAVGASADILLSPTK